MSRDQLFHASDARDFKRQFAIQYMAAYVAGRTDECCSRGQHESLRNPPVEDARHLAECAWEKWVEHVGLCEESVVLVGELSK